MGADTDFNALYDELGVHADCDIAQFKHAYRRRVGSLHPDHRGTDIGLARLQQLNQSYTRVLEFHRMHGRLPGAARAQAGHVPYHVPNDVAPPSAPVAGKTHLTRYSVLVGLVATALLWLYSTSSAGPSVVLGMDAADVRVIQGEPSAVHEPRWEYGPSWIEFRCGKVFDWYSAPGHPLQVEDDPDSGGHPASPAPVLDC